MRWGSALALTSLAAWWSASCAFAARRMPPKKANLPSKVCVVCERPFTWRKKWERCWDEVQTCSKRCNTERRRRKARSDDETAPTESDDETAPTESDRKSAKKAMKAARRAKREGKSDGRKPCDLCGRPVDLLVRCRVDETRAWRMVCGTCWHSVSGGVPDGDALHPHYQYGGLWRNRARRTITTNVVSFDGAAAAADDDDESVVDVFRPSLVNE